MFIDIAGGFRSIGEDLMGGLWIGTWAGGLYRLDRSAKWFGRYIHEPNEPNSLKSNNDFRFLEDPDGTL